MVMVHEVVIEGITALRTSLRGAVIALKATTAQLGAWAVPFVLAHVVIGCGPLVSSLLLGATIDALIGARGVGVMTSELTADLWQFGILIVVAFTAYLFTVKFTGTAAFAGYVLMMATALVTTLLGLLWYGRIEYAVVMLILHVLLGMYRAKLALRLVILLLVLFALGVEIATTVQFTVARSFTVGEAMTMIALASWCAVLLKLRAVRTNTVSV